VADIEKGESKKPASSGVVDTIWGWLASIKLALILILVIGGLGIIGTFIATSNFFQSWYFLAAGALLMINILVCSINRWSSIVHIIKGGQINKNEGFYMAGVPRGEISNPFGNSRCF